MLEEIKAWFTIEEPVSAEQTKIIIDQIHKEFNTAGEQLMLEAKDLLATLSEEEIRKAERLAKLGFTESTTVKGNKDKVVLKELAHKNLKIINEYAIAYPNQKFITEEQVEAICKKYNLVCGLVSTYKGFVPEKNLKEIEVFGGVKSQHRAAEMVQILKLKVSYSFYRDWNPIIKDFIKRGIKVSNIDSWRLSSELREHKKKYFPRYKTEYDTPSFDPAEAITVPGSDSLLICAPLKDMNTKGLKQVGFQFFQTKRISFPDPVVLKPIQGGYLILTAWGDEASDPLVVNEKMN